MVQNGKDQLFCPLYFFCQLIIHYIRILLSRHQGLMVNWNNISRKVNAKTMLKTLHLSIGNRFIITTKKKYKLLPWNLRWQHRVFTWGYWWLYYLTEQTPKCWPLPNWVCWTLVPCSDLPSVWIQDDYSHRRSCRHVEMNILHSSPPCWIKAELSGGNRGEEFRKSCHFRKYCF